MKKLGARLAVIAVLSMIAVGCGSTVDKIKVGMTEQEVIAVLGEPRYRVGPMSTEENRFQYYRVDDQDITVWFMDGRVSRVRITPSAPEGLGPPP